MNVIDWEVGINFGKEKLEVIVSGVAQTTEFLFTGATFCGVFMVEATFCVSSNTTFTIFTYF